MSVKLFVTDLDGTLLPSGKDVPRENIEAVQKAVRAGVIVTIATGRMYRAALPVAEALGVDVPIITYNGALIKSTKGKVYHTSYLKPEVIEQVVDFCQEQGWYLQSYSRDELWVPVHDEHAQRYEQEKIDAQAAADRLAADLRAGNVSLHRRWEACSATADLSAAFPGAGLADGGADDRAESAGRAVAAAAACDAQVRGLQAVLMADRTPAEPAP